MARTEGGEVFWFLMSGSPRQENFAGYVDKKTMRLLPNPPYRIEWFDYRIFSRKSDDKADTDVMERRYRISQAIFYPSFNFLGYQNSFLIGSTDGVMIKYNSNCGMLPVQQEHSIHLL